jgi:nucleotide-binding universal stress UspA family protein
VFERILLAIDDSPGSEVATSFAAALARRTGASVHVFMVNEYLVGGRGATLHTNDEARRIVTDAVDALWGAGVSASGSAVAASYRRVARRIVDAASEQGAGAIVLGSHRHKGLSRLLSPRVRERTLRMTTLPILTAPAPLMLLARPSLGVDELIDTEVAGRVPAPLA